MKRSNLLTRCLAVMLTFTLALGLVNVPVFKTSAKSSDTIEISTSDIVRTGDTYKFNTVTTNLTSGVQHILCIKVNKGCFRVDPSLMAGVYMTGITYNDENNATDKDYTSSITSSTNLKLCTIKGDFGADAIIKFIKGITFDRSDVTSTVDQKVSFIASNIKLGENETAMVLEDVLHVYRYVRWNNSTLRGAKASDLSTFTYYNAYNEAKASTYVDKNGLNTGLYGYLATITEDYEHDFIYNDVSTYSSWVGGVRTLIKDGSSTTYPNGAKFDDATLDSNAVNPGDRNNDMSLVWRWICGPEAGDTFYTLANNRNCQQNEEEAAAVLESHYPYSNWNDNEPNNFLISVDKYLQEYCLEYGYNGQDGKWNDWDPEVSLRYGTGDDQLNNVFNVSGYIIEYSPYTSPSTGVTYSYNSDSQPAIEVVYVGSSSASSDAGTKAVEAEDYTISVTDAASSTIDSIIKKSSAKVTSGGSTVADATITTADLAKLTSAKAGDKVEITLTSTGASSKTITVTVTEDNPSITAHDFFITKTDAAKATAATVRSLSDATGTKNDGTTCGDITVDATALTNLNKASSGDAISIKLTNPDATAKTKTVTAKVFDVVTDNTSGTGDAKNEQIAGNGYTVTGGGSSETAATVISKSAAAALDKNGDAIDSSKLVVNTSDLKKLNDAIAANEDTVVEVTVSTPNGTSVKIPVTVKKGEEVYPNIKAHDFLISTTDAAKAKAADVITLADATSAKSDKSANTPSVTEGLTNLNKAAAGDSVSITFTNPDATDLTKKVTAKVFENVTSNNKSGDLGEGEQIGGNGYTVPSSKTSETAAEVLKNGLVTALDKDGNPISLTDSAVDTADLKLLNDAIKVGKPTVVNVTVSTPNGTSVEIPVTVEGTIEYPAVVANDFFISKKDAENITDTVAKKDSAVVVYDKDGNVVSNPTVTVSDLDMVKTTASGNSTNIKFSTTVDGKELTDIAKVSVFDSASNGTGNDTDKSVVSIGANDFTITLDQAKSTSSVLQALAKQLSTVKALDDGVSVDVSKIAADVSKIKAEESSTGYDVTFEYLGVKTTVKAYVVDSTTKEDKITAQNFFISKSDASTADDDKVKYYSHVQATDADGKPIADEYITVDGSDAIKKADVGDSVPVKLSTSTSSTNVTAKIFDSAHNGKGTSGKNVSIGANDYELTVAQAGNTSTLASVSKSFSSVAALSNGGNVDLSKISVDTSNIKAKAGTYDVTFTYDGASITVKATVKDDATTGKVTVTANDKEVVRGTDPMTKKQILELINASGVNDLGENVDVTISDADVKKFNSALNDSSVSSVDLTVTDSDGNKKVVTITFKDADGTVGQDKTFEISNPSDVVEIIDKNKSVSKVTIDDVEIPTSSYKVTDDGDLIIDQDYIKKYDPDKRYKVVVTYTDGTDLDFNLTVIDYNDYTVVKVVPIMKMTKNVLIGEKFKLNLKGIKSNSVKIYKSSNKKVASINKKGVIKGKKQGKAKITAYIIQNGSYYKVKVNVKVYKKSKSRKRNLNLKKKALVAVQGKLPEFNVYKRVKKGKKTTLKFTNVQVDKKSDISFFIPSKYKKEKKYLKVGKVSYNSKKKIATCKIKGKKLGFVHLTCKIKQNGKVYYTRIFVRIDNGKKIKGQNKYLK